jgi:hypothetical protein
MLRFVSFRNVLAFLQLQRKDTLQIHKHTTLLIHQGGLGGQESGHRKTSLDGVLTGPKWESSWRGIGSGACFGTAAFSLMPCIKTLNDLGFCFKLCPVAIYH